MHDDEGSFCLRHSSLQVKSLLGSSTTYSRVSSQIHLQSLKENLTCDLESTLFSPIKRFWCKAFNFGSSTSRLKSILQTSWMCSLNLNGVLLRHSDTLIWPRKASSFDPDCIVGVYDWMEETKQWYMIGCPIRDDEKVIHHYFSFFFILSWEECPHFLFLQLVARGGRRA